MTVITKGVMQNGTPVQIEDWSADYSFRPYASTLAAYPISKASLEGYFAPRRNERFRCSFSFESAEAAQEAYECLTNGSAVLADFVQQLYDPKHVDCV